VSMLNEVSAASLHNCADTIAWVLPAATDIRHGCLSKCKCA
jgi:hypothetical protein